MNKTRRQQLAVWSRKAEALKDELDDIMRDEQDYYDNIPENLQYSQRAEDSENAIGQMEEAIGQLEEVINIVDEII
jgi:hypothetical protein